MSHLKRHAPPSTMAPRFDSWKKKRQFAHRDCSIYQQMFFSTVKRFFGGKTESRKLNMMALKCVSVELLPKDINGPYQTTFVALVSRKKLKESNKVICICTAATMKLNCFCWKCQVRNKSKYSSLKLRFEKSLQMLRENDGEHKMLCNKSVGLRGNKSVLLEEIHNWPTAFTAVGVYDYWPSIRTLLETPVTKSSINQKEKTSRLAECSVRRRSGRRQATRGVKKLTTCPED